MKRKACIFLVLVFIFVLISSCKTKEIPKLSQETVPPVKRLETLDDVPEPKYSLPEAPSAEEIPPAVQQPAPAPLSPPASQPQKKTTGPKPLSSYETPILNRDKERIDNIRLAIKKLNGYKLKPGEIFSFNNVVGKRDASTGFKVAAVIVNGEFGEDMGGGVCQLSSTIFNAADRAGMQIIERHSHSRSVAYVPAGRDAAISYGYLDLKFKNTKDYTVVISAKVEGAKLKAYIYKKK